MPDTQSRVSICRRRDVARVPHTDHIQSITESVSTESEEECESICKHCVLDKCTYTGPDSSMSCSSLADRGLRVNSSKCKRWSGGQDETQEPLQVLGVPIGHPRAVTNAVTEVCDTQSEVIPLLSALPPSVAFALLHACVNARPMFLARCAAPWTTSPGLKMFDTRITEGLKSIMGLTGEVLPDKADAIRGLPLRLGGLGLRRLDDLAETAFVASFLRAASAIPACSSFLLHSSVEQAARLADIVALVESILPNHVSQVVRPATLMVWETALLGGEPNPLPEVPSQRELLALDEERQWDNTLNLVASDGDRAGAAWLRSAAFKGSGGWLLASLQATATTCRLHEDEFRLNVLLRLGVRPSWASPAGAMECSRCRAAGHRERLDLLFHGLNCASLSGPRIHRHNYVRDCLADILRRLFGGHAVTTEVRLESPGANTVVADIALQTGAGVRYFDVAIPNPSAGTALARQSDTSTLAAARVAEGEKRAHYRAALAHRGLAPSAFIPFVVEATGRLGEAATTFVEQVVTYPDIQATDAAGTVRFGMARLQTLIARGNAIAIKAFARGARAIG